MAHSQLIDAEFGAIAIRRSKLSRHVKLKIDARGGISVSMPMRAPLFLAKSLLAQSRTQIRTHLAKAEQNRAYLLPGDLIGKSHRLVVRTGDGYSSRLHGTELHVMLPPDTQPESTAGQHYIKEAALKALRTQAKAYLTRRLETLAAEYDFTYETVRFSNAGTRWGSCSTNGTISLNIWLMQLPFTLIDYVIIHELCHTRHMNHSANFWAAVEDILPDYRVRRTALKAQHPYV